MSGWMSHTSHPNLRTRWDPKEQTVQLLKTPDVDLWNVFQELDIQVFLGKFAWDLMGFVEWTHIWSHFKTSSRGEEAGHRFLLVIHSHFSFDVSCAALTAVRSNSEQTWPSNSAKLQPGFNETLLAQMHASVILHGNRFIHVCPFEIWQSLATRVQQPVTRVLFQG